MRFQESEKEIQRKRTGIRHFPYIELICASSLALHIVLNSARNDPWIESPAWPPPNVKMSWGFLTRSEAWHIQWPKQIISSLFFLYAQADVSSIIHPDLLLLQLSLHPSPIPEEVSIGKLGLDISEQLQEIIMLKHRHYSWIMHWQTQPWTQRGSGEMFFSMWPMLF